MGTTYGIVTKEIKGLPKGALKHFFRTFFEHNEDQREAIIAEAMNDVKVLINFIYRLFQFFPSFKQLKIQYLVTFLDIGFNDHL